MAFYYKLFFPNQVYTLDDITKLSPYMYCGCEEPTVRIPRTASSEPISFTFGSSASSGKIFPPHAPSLISGEVNSTASSTKGITSSSREGACGGKILPEEAELPKVKLMGSEDAVRGIRTVGSLHFPNKPDSLFWSVYIALHGYDSYQKIGHRYGNIEIEEKHKMMEMMKKHPNKIKECPKKITKVLFQEVMSDFMTNKKMTGDMLLMFALYYEKNIWIIKWNEVTTSKKMKGRSETLAQDPLTHSESKRKNMYIYLPTSSAVPTHPPQDYILIYRKGKYQYGIDLTEGEEQIQQRNKIAETMYQFDHIEKPLKSISHYTVSDLENIHKRLMGVKEGEFAVKSKMKKPELYNTIMNECIDFML